MFDAGFGPGLLHRLLASWPRLSLVGLTWTIQKRLSACAPGAGCAEKAREGWDNGSPVPDGLYQSSSSAAKAAATSPAATLRILAWLRSIEPHAPAANCPRLGCKCAPNQRLQNLLCLLGAGRLG